LLVHDRWLSPGIPASSSTKAGRLDTAEILLKVALSTINQIKQWQITGMLRLFITKTEKKIFAIFLW
jgi:hypothetical protein